MVEIPLTPGQGGAIRPPQANSGNQPGKSAFASGSFNAGAMQKPDNQGIFSANQNPAGKTQVMPRDGKMVEAKPKKSFFSRFGFGKKKEEAKTMPKIIPPIAPVKSEIKSALPTPPPIIPKSIPTPSPIASTPFKNEPPKIPPAKPVKTSGSGMFGKAILVIVILVLLGGVVWQWWQLNDLKKGLDVKSISDLSKSVTDLQTEIGNIKTETDNLTKLADLETALNTLQTALGEVDLSGLSNLILLVKEYDADNDGLSDYEEKFTYQTDLKNPDTDGDGYQDGVEVDNGYNPKGEGKLETDNDPVDEPVSTTEAESTFNEFMSNRVSRNEQAVMAKVDEDFLTRYNEERLTTALLGNEQSYLAQYEIVNTQTADGNIVEFEVKEYLSTSSDSNDFTQYIISWQKIGSEWFLTGYDTVGETTDENQAVQDLISEFMDARVSSNQVVALQYLTETAKDRYQFLDILTGQQDPHYDSYEVLMQEKNNDEEVYTANVEINEASSGVQTNSFTEELKIIKSDNQWLIDEINGNIYQE